MASLIVISRINGSATACECSDCKQIFYVPSDGTKDEKEQMIKQKFEEHVREKHSPAKLA